MALIKCPECGRSVSDKAVACPDCGYPIAKNNPVGKVEIKISCYVIFNIKFTDSAGRELARGRTGDVISIHVDKPTMVSANVSGAPNALMKAGERWELAETGRTFTHVMAFRKVDAII